MPDNITFNSIPIDIRTPGQYIEKTNAAYADPANWLAERR